MKLPEVQKSKPIMRLFESRKSSREFQSKELEMQEISNILWAAFGISREDGRRTAPTARNIQDIELYVVNQTAVYLYKPETNELTEIVKGDFRKNTGLQDFVGIAPLEIVIVSDHSKMEVDEIIKTSYSCMNTGFVSENIYLYCASENLATVTRGSIERVELAQILKLKQEQKIILVQSVGYPKE
ncbi:MAG: nitroreductase family protein [bacterium]